jgi:hypothetical protein
MTKGWKLCVKWKDGTASWEWLTDLKESYPIKVAEFAISPGSPGKWFKKMSVNHLVNNLCAGAIFFGVTLRNFFNSLRVFSLRNFSLRRIFIV